MVALPQVYNVSDLPDTGGNSVLIPPAKYPAVVIDSGMKPTKDGAGQFLWLKVIITQGQYANTEFTERLNILNNSAKAVEIAYKTLARISEAVGMMQTPSDSSQLHNKPLMIDVVTEPAEDWTDKDGQVRKGKEKSIINKFLAIPRAGAVGSFGAPAFGAGATAPAPAPAAFGQPTAVAANAAPPGTAPWTATGR